MFTLVNGLQHFGSQEYTDTRFIKIVRKCYCTVFTMVSVWSLWDCLFFFYGLFKKEILKTPEYAIKGKRFQIGHGAKEIMLFHLGRRTHGWS